jgi:hypothetical protein
MQAGAGGGVRLLNPDRSDSSTPKIYGSPYMEQIHWAHAWFNPK